MTNEPTLRPAVSDHAGGAAQEVRSLDLAEPTGWIYVRLKRPGDGDDGGGMRAYLVQLLVQTNHQNGRDTHVRQIKVFGPRKCVCPRRDETIKALPSSNPRPDAALALRRDMVQAAGLEESSTVAFSQYAVVR